MRNVTNLYFNGFIANVTYSKVCGLVWYIKAELSIIISDCANFGLIRDDDRNPDERIAGRSVCDFACVRFSENGCGS